MRRQEFTSHRDDSTGIVPAALELEPDLLVLDLKMPAMGGIDVVREMRRRKLEIPVVLLAATMADVEIVAAVQVGVRGIVLKDQSADELIDTIRGVVRGEKRIAPELVQRARDAALFEDAVTAGARARHIHNSFYADPNFRWVLPARTALEFRV